MEDSAMSSTVRFERTPSKAGGAPSGRTSDNFSPAGRLEELSPSPTHSTATGADALGGGFNRPDISAASGWSVDSDVTNRGFGRGTTASNWNSSDRTAKGQKLKGEPRPGMQDMVRIKSVTELNQAIRILVGMVSNCWSGSNASVTCFRQVLPGLARVHVGSDVYVLPGFLLQDLEPILSKSMRAGNGDGGRMQITDPLIQDVTCRSSTPYFKHIVVLLKLRWLLRLHSACCELDYKMCSCANLIKGIQYVAVQQYAEAEADSIFDSKVNVSGSHVNVESLTDDIFDQLQRALGKSWHAFLEYVSTCDPTRSVHFSRMDLAPAPVVSNDSLMTVIDTIFVTYFLRGGNRIAASDLKGCLEHIEMLGLPVPELPPLRRAQNLRMWAKAKTKPTRQDRDRANKKDMEKLAQLDALLLCAAVELKSTEILATPEEIADMNVTTSLPKNMAGDVAPTPVDFGSTGKAEGGPPAARVILIDKPQLSPTLFNAVVSVVQHHLTFPAGIRERFYSLITEEYGLTREQSERLAIAVTQSIDGKRLPTQKLIEMEAREKVRLRNYEVETYKDCSHLLVPALVPQPSERHKPAKYIWPPPVQKRLPFGSAFSSSDMTRSLPDMRGFTAKHDLGREPFKVPLSTGPLTMDPDLHKLRTTGFFIKMPPLK